MTNGPRRFRAGYRSPSTGEWVLGSSVVTDAVVGYHDPDTDEWIEGIADIESGEWIPVDATRGTGARDCPAGFPVKGNLPSRVFHTPGQPDYDRTTPEVCFASEDAASGAGFRHARSRPPAAAAAPAAAEAPVAAAACRGSSSRRGRRAPTGCWHATATGTTTTDRPAATSRVKSQLALVDPGRSRYRRAALVVLLPSPGGSGRRSNARGDSRRSGGHGHRRGRGRRGAGRHRRNARAGESGRRGRDSKVTCRDPHDRGHG